jgi:ferric-dicitrate binding protein FerR (iron transport regulator)
MLVGKAFFKVATDKTKPFTVFSGDISTTALGTAFTVTTFKNDGQIIVRLYEGKVVVKAVDRKSKKLKKDVYLFPGQAFVYGGGPAKAKVNAFAVNNTAAPEQIMSEETAEDNPSLPENPDGTYFMFNNQPLAKVLDDLAALYNTKIVYNKTDVENLYFIGKYNSTDSVEMILRRIASLNNLTLTTENDAYILSK